jgi:hypothetical protein
VSIEQHAQFRQRLHGSYRAVFVYAIHLHLNEHTVTILPTRSADTAEESQQFRDNGDLIVDGKYRHEVKGRNLDFTCAEDFRFDSVLVSNCKAVDRAGNEVVAYVSLNAAFTHFASIPRSTKEHWRIVWLLAGNTGNYERNYACPKQYVTFGKLLTEAPHEQTAHCTGRRQR